jgi:TIR domain-containing protein
VKVTIFVSYSHADTRYLEDGSLLGYLKGLEDEDVVFWSDKNLVVGDNWDELIKARINEANIALVLVSQMFLDSDYCKNVEISGFLRQCRKTGLVVFPIILSACEWQRHEWLKSTQFLPKGGETLEEHYTSPGQQKRLFYEILQDLRDQIDRVRKSRQSQPEDMSATPGPSRPVEVVERTDRVSGVADRTPAPTGNPAISDVGVAGTSAAATESPAPATASASAELKLKGQLDDWVSRILTVQNPATGGFDSSLFEPEGRSDIWTTAQCLTGILNTREGVARIEEARLAFSFLQRCQGQDNGWGYSESQEAVTEVSAWVTVAYGASFETGIWNDQYSSNAAAKVVDRTLDHILRRKRADGGWSPISQVVPRDTRTYTTMMTLWGLLRAKNAPGLTIGSRLDKHIATAIRWLLDTRRDNLGWVPNPNRIHQLDRHLGLNAQVLFVLTQAENASQFLRNFPGYKRVKREFLSDQRWLAYDFFQNTSIRDIDQGFDDTDYKIEGSTFLWCPWSLAALHALSIDAELSADERDQATKLRGEVIKKIQESSDDIGTGGTYELAETLFCVAYALK